MGQSKSSLPGTEFGVRGLVDFSEHLKARKRARKKGLPSAKIIPIHFTSVNMQTKRVSFIQQLPVLTLN